MFQVTPAAANEILAAAERSQAAGMALRVAARQGPDGSIDYGMGFDEAREDDEPVRFGALTVLVGSPSKHWLDGTVLDYIETAPGHHDFLFIPAPAPAAGGCGGGGGAEPSARRACGSGACGSCGA